MTVRIEICGAITAILLPIISGEENIIEIEPCGEQYKVTFDDFVAEGAELCGYTWSYKAYLNGN